MLSYKLPRLRIWLIKLQLERFPSLRASEGLPNLIARTRVTLAAIYTRMLDQHYTAPHVGGVGWSLTNFVCTVWLIIGNALVLALLVIMQWMVHWCIHDFAEYDPRFEPTGSCSQRWMDAASTKIFISPGVLGYSLFAYHRSLGQQKPQWS